MNYEYRLGNNMFEYKQPTISKSGRIYDNDSRKVFIPFTFERPIIQHVLLNTLRKSNPDLSVFRPTAMLFLQGQKGEGKTYMTETVLKGNGIKFDMVSSSELAGPKEGDAVNKLTAHLIKLKSDPSIEKFTALVVDDFHLSIAANIGNASSTTNAFNLLEKFMSLAGEPEYPPVILIGNDFTNTYAPLMRHGRAKIESWIPTLQEKTEIVSVLLSNHGFSADNAKTLVNTYPEQYIGFFEQVIEQSKLSEFYKVTDMFIERKQANQICSIVELTAIITSVMASSQVDFSKILEQANSLNQKSPENFDSRAVNTP